MTETPSPLPPEAQRKSGPSLVWMLIIAGVFFLVVLAIAVLLLPDKGKRLLRLARTHPVTETIASAPPAPLPAAHPFDPSRIR